MEGVHGLSPLFSIEQYKHVYMGTVCNYEYRSHSNVHTEQHGFPSFPGIDKKSYYNTMRYHSFSVL